MTPAPSDTRLAGSRIKGLNCPNCGAALSIRGFEHTLTVVCPQCLSILDAKDPNLQILQKFASKTRIQPLIPLGSRGSWRGVVYEVIGFQRRTVTSDGVDYSWSEYLLFNPYKGFRYLTEYNGHWNDLRTLRALPQNPPGGALRLRPNVMYDNTTFLHFSTAQVRTTYVLGEFPWQVKRGETCAGRDFIAPPKILSCEQTPAESVWSIGVYVGGGEVWQAFKLSGSPPRPVGVYLNQPSMLALASKELWSWWGIFTLLALSVMMLGYILSGDQQVFRDDYTFPSNGARQEASFVTPVFELKGRTSNVEVSTTTNLFNNWTYFNYALINADTGEAFDFGREVSYYTGRDSDGTWTEGNKDDKATLPGIVSGKYYLRVGVGGMRRKPSPVRYEISVRRDVPRSSWFLADCISSDDSASRSPRSGVSALNASVGRRAITRRFLRAAVETTTDATPFVFIVWHLAVELDGVRRLSRHSLPRRESQRNQERSQNRAR